MLDAELGEGGGDQLAVPVPEAPGPAQVSIAAHPHHVRDRHRKGGLDVEPLRDERHPAARDLDRPGAGARQSDRGAKEGGLARSVRPEEGDGGARRDLDTDVLEGCLAPVADGQPGRLDRCHYLAAQRAQSPWITMSCPLIEWRSRPARRSSCCSSRSSSKAVTRPQVSQTAW